MERAIVKLQEGMSAIAQRMLDAGHQTAWTACDTERDGKRGRCFVFISINGDIATKAEQVLADAELLCDEDLGELK